MTAGYLSIKTHLLAAGASAGQAFQGYLDSTLMVIFIVGVVVVLFEAARRCWETLHGAPIPEEAFGKPEVAAVNMGCC